MQSQGSQGSEGACAALCPVVNIDLSLSVDGPAPGVLSLPNDRWAVLKERFKNITLLGLAGPAAETWWQDCTDR